MVDVVCAESPRAGERVHADVSVRAGGSAVNAALAAARAGAPAAVVGRVGDDTAAELLLVELAHSGVTAHLARDPARPTGAAVAFAAPDGKPAVVASRGANAAFCVDDVPAALDEDTLLVSGFALLQPGSDEAARAAMTRFTGRWVGVDVGSPRLAAVARNTRFPPSDAQSIVFATAEEARALTDAEPEAAARLLAMRFDVACVKLGAGGAIAATRGDVVRARANQVEASSPFGAGDAFAAVLLVELAAGRELGDALGRACAAGAAAAAGL